MRIRSLLGETEREKSAWTRGGEQMAPICVILCRKKQEGAAFRRGAFATDRDAVENKTGLALRVTSTPNTLQHNQLKQTRSSSDVLTNLKSIPISANRSSGLVCN